MIILTDKGPISVGTVPSSAKGFSTDSLIFRENTLWQNPFATKIVPDLYFANGDISNGSKLNPLKSYSLLTDTGTFKISWALETFTSLDTTVKKVVITTPNVSVIDPISSRGLLRFYSSSDLEYWDNSFLAASFGSTTEIGDKRYVEIQKLFLCHKFSQLFKITANKDGSEIIRYFITFTFNPEIQASIKSKVTSFGYTDVSVDYVITDYDTIYQYINGDLLNGNSVYAEIANPDDVKLSVEPKNTDAYIGDKVTYNVKYIYRGTEYPGVPSVNVSATTGITKPAYFGSPSYDYTVTITDDAPKNCFVTFYDTVTNRAVSATINVINGVDQTGNNSPYLPEGGGISGGGAQSGSSNVIGSFDGTPGPSVVGGIPDGAVGSDIASSGMYTKYLCDAGTLNVIAQYLWEDNVGIQALKAIIGNPIDSIISLISYPFALDSLVPITSTKIYFGKYNSLLSAKSITKSSIKIDWGTVEIPFFWGGFLDYSPYTQIQLYLPWGVGFVSLDPNEVMPWSPKNSYTQGSFTNGSVRVVTNIELDKGSCVHNVIGNNGRVIGSFGGICGKQVPVVGTNDAARTLALIGAAVSAGTTLGMAATGQPALGKGLAYGKNMSQMNRAEGREMLADYNSAVSGMLASSKATAKSPPTYPRAGTFSDATSHLSVQYPYLIISRPSQSMPGQYGRFMGYPSNIFHNHLGEVKGYTEVSSIHLDDIPATSTELNELESILKGGVLL